ncbi:MAG: hypothetical protein U0U66_03410 [Cytophagaceae bacterium]
MATQIVRAQISQITITETTDDHADIIYQYSIELNDKCYFFSHEEKLDIYSKDQVVIRANDDCSILDLYDYTTKEKYGTKWKELKKENPVIDSNFVIKEGIVEKKILVTDRIYNNSIGKVNHTYSRRIRYYHVFVDGEQYSMSYQEGNFVKKRDKIAFLHAEDKNGVSVFQNLTTGKNTLSVFPINIILYSICLLLCVFCMMYAFSLEDKALIVTLLIFLGIAVLVTSLYLMYEIRRRLFEVEKMKELLHRK